MAIDDTLKDLAVMTPQERVDEWRGLYEQFRQHTPGSPDWYYAIDYMVGALISDHIEALEKQRDAALGITSAAIRQTPASKSSRKDKEQGHGAR